MEKEKHIIRLKLEDCQKQLELKNEIDKVKQDIDRTLKKEVSPKHK